MLEGQGEWNVALPLVTRAQSGDCWRVLDGSVAFGRAEPGHDDVAVARRRREGPHTLACGKSPPPHPTISGWRARRGTDEVVMIVAWIRNPTAAITRQALAP